MDDALKSEELPLEPFRCILNQFDGSYLLARAGAGPQGNAIALDKGRNAPDVQI